MVEVWGEVVEMSMWRPRSGVHRVTCPTCAGEDGEQELPPMYDPREDLGR